MALESDAINDKAGTGKKLAQLKSFYNASNRYYCNDPGARVHLMFLCKLLPEYFALQQIQSTYFVRKSHKNDPRSYLIPASC